MAGRGRSGGPARVDAAALSPSTKLQINSFARASPGDVSESWEIFMLRWRTWSEAACNFAKTRFERGIDLSSAASASCEAVFCGCCGLSPSQALQRALGQQTASSSSIEDCGFYSRPITPIRISQHVVHRRRSRARLEEHCLPRVSPVPLQRPPVEGVLQAPVRPPVRHPKLTFPPSSPPLLAPRLSAGESRKPSGTA